jgi:hypothetical protein
MKNIFTKPESLYTLLVIGLILSKLLMQNTWPSDQLIVYNFLSILMISVVLNIFFSGKPLLFKLMPLLIVLYIFFNPEILKILFFASHLVLLFLLTGLLIWRKFDAFSYKSIGISAVPLELMLLFFFL